MICVIAEKHDIAKSISEALGKAKREKGYYKVGDYIITHCVGHLLEIELETENKNWAWNTLPIEAKNWKYHTKVKVKEQYDIVKSLIAKADTIIHAGDPDDEGQLIVDEILFNEGIIDYKGYQKKTVKRLLINDNNPEFIKKELAKLKDNKDYLGLTLKALSRSLADITFGYNLTRALTLKNNEAGNQGVISVGRVQTPMLALIVRRDIEIKNHVKNFYYEIFTNFMGSKLKYKIKDNEKDENGFLTEDISKTILERVKNNISNAIIKKTKKDNVVKTPPLPYNLLKLQVDCSKQFKMKADKVLAVTQSLREKYKAITYNRSDCEYLHDDSHAEAPTLLSNLSNIEALRDLINTCDTALKSKCFNSSKTSAHTAIIPTQTKLKIEEMTADERAVYLLIAKRYALQFLPNAILNKYTNEIAVNDDIFLNAYTMTENAGWMNYEKVEADEEEKETSSVKIEFEDQSSLRATDLNIDVEKNETKPKKPYTTATFLTDLTSVAKYCKDEKIKNLLKEKDKNIAGEHGGIGTPATRSSILNTLYEREYIEDKGNTIVATRLGIDLIASLPDNITYPDMTALWHEQLKEVETKNLSSDEFVKNVFNFSKTEVESIKNKEVKFDNNAIKCSCGGSIVRKKSNKGFFWACTNYPDCKISYQDKNGKPDIYETVACPECKDKGQLHKFKGKENYFWKCKNEECSKIFSDKDGKPNLEPKAVASDKYKCLICNSKLAKKEGKYGAFWSCTNYPVCKTNYSDNGGEPVYQKEERK